MQLYYMDCGWAGCIAVWASSEIEARDMMKEVANYDESRPVEVKQLVPGIIICNLGDM